MFPVIHPMEDQVEEEHETSIAAVALEFRVLYELKNGPVKTVADAMKMLNAFLDAAYLTPMQKK